MSNNTTHTFEYLSSEWIAYQIFSALIFMISLYICLSCLLRERFASRALNAFQQTRSRTTNVSALSEENNISSVYSVAANSTNASGVLRATNASSKQPPANDNSFGNRNPPRIRLLFVTALVFMVIRCSVALFEVHLGWKYSVACRVCFFVIIFSYGFSNAATYMLFWERQRRFYAHPAMRRSLRSKYLINLSWSAFALIIIALTCNILTFALTSNHFASSTGCERIDLGIPFWLKAVLLSIWTILHQIILVVLMVYPLVRYYSASGIVMPRNARNIMPVIKRLATATVICILSDITVTILASFTSQPFMSHLLYNVNLVVNVVCAVMTFGDWKLRLNAFVYFWKRKENIPSIRQTEL
ncbi:uncharacterized protein LOC143462936 [Clavelina lepadiformis]|uniref:uncharacterized protein LOC143462936 n=1 Tax=Clavelina lepadiformis TaxID=159417 RepID=UPI004042059A